MRITFNKTDKVQKQNLKTELNKFHKPKGEINMNKHKMFE